MSKLGFYTVSNALPGTPGDMVVEIRSRLDEAARFRVAYLPSFAGGPGGQPTLKFVDVPAMGTAQVPLDGDGDQFYSKEDVSVAVRHRQGIEHLPVVDGL